MTNAKSGLWLLAAGISRWISMAIGGIVGIFGSIVGILYLLVLSALAILYAVVALTAIQVREELKTAGGEQGSVSYEEVNASRDRYDRRLAAIDDSINSLQPEQIELEKQIYNHEIEITRLANNIYFWDSGGNEPPAEFDPYSYSERQSFLVLVSFCKDIEPTANLPENRDYLQNCKEIEDYRASLTNRQNLISTYDSTYGPDYYIEKLTERQRKIDELRAAEPLHKYYSTLRFFEQDLDFFGIGRNFTRILTIPSEVLTLFLTMAMGLLGSVVTMTWSYVRQDNDLTLRRFLVLPFVGSISAFIIFIFISAGQLTLTAGADSGTLSPFVLSFVGIISGLLSERAYVRIADVGTSFFQTGEGQPRWANRLWPAMEESGVDIGLLSRHLGLSETEVTAIADESATATLDQQRLIAACVRQPIRDIFTDVPPVGLFHVNTDAPVGARSPLTTGNRSAETPDGAPQPVTVPDLSSLSETDAIEALQAADLRLGETTFAEDEAAVAGTVLGQIPAAGQMVPAGTSVNITLSTGPANPPGVG